MHNTVGRVTSDRPPPPALTGKGTLDTPARQRVRRQVISATVGGNDRPVAVHYANRPAAFIPPSREQASGTRRQFANFSESGVLCAGGPTETVSRKGHGSRPCRTNVAKDIIIISPSRPPDFLKRKTQKVRRVIRFVFFFYAYPATERNSTWSLS